MEKKFQLWEIDFKSIGKLTPEKVRDLIIECFFHAQKETFKYTKKKLYKKEPTDDEIRNSVITLVQMTFKEIGGDFDNPSLDALKKVVENLAKKAKAWGTPDEIINHHKNQIEKLIKIAGG